MDQGCLGLGLVSAGSSCRRVPMMLSWLIAIVYSFWQQAHSLVVCDTEPGECLGVLCEMVPVTPTRIGTVVTVWP
jgi:hypothetical protein